MEEKIPIGRINEFCEFLRCHLEAARQKTAADLCRSVCLLYHKKKAELNTTSSADTNLWKGTVISHSLTGFARWGSRLFSAKDWKVLKKKRFKLNAFEVLYMDLRVYLPSIYSRGVWNRCKYSLLTFTVIFFTLFGWTWSFKVCSTWT